VSSGKGFNKTIELMLEEKLHVSTTEAGMVLMAVRHCSIGTTMVLTENEVCELIGLLRQAVESLKLVDIKSLDTGNVVSLPTERREADF
jgi:hypothetical protein